MELANLSFYTSIEHIVTLVAYYCREGYTFNLQHQTIKVNRG